ncbi:MAG: hypothetical protein JEY96_16675 [Bacteroidales bacterium]|nr:hypothetical protein [Bacteroidales bacterium]
MIVIAEFDIINPFGIPITDWIQSIGALVAILGAIYAFAKLFIKDKEKQIQINSLTKIAEESENQSVYLAYQLDQMIESNKIQTQYLSLLQESTSANKEKVEIDKERIELEKKQRRISLKPYLQFSTGLVTPELHKLNLINKGEKAIITNFEELEKNSVNHNIKGLIGSELSKNQRISVIFKPKPFGLMISQCFVNIKVILEDIEGNKYYQLITGPGNRIKVDSPVEIE